MVEQRGEEISNQNQLGECDTVNTNFKGRLILLLCMGTLTSSRAQS